MFGVIFVTLQIGLYIKYIFLIMESFKSFYLVCTGSHQSISDYHLICFLTSMLSDIRPICCHR